MDSLTHEILTRLKAAFADESGPAMPNFEIPESCAVFELYSIRNLLIRLHPEHLKVEELYPGVDYFVLRHCEGKGLKWLLPGLVRAAFAEREGWRLFRDTFLLLRDRMDGGDLDLSKAQAGAVLEAFDAFYYVRGDVLPPQPEELAFVRFLRTLAEVA